MYDIYFVDVDVKYVETKKIKGKNEGKCTRDSV